ncbi:MULTISPECIES: enoyl-CoA hydratase/isomerase family protein [unclassified Variovorax]|jgi:enoyl-CoA hydratase|uniref:enoyl-CoA hydratase/isomerase family protein n=1 Tax=unclassified Variovorax TaxID=663243 RepID=UPI00086C3EB5|nr:MULTISPECIES: enoyl-CoA hydratase/isomerase family protein [unclassified Variovorax]MBN8755629.1 enoyl-CoA hydratase/isomerase family protein [Variovorax sp.]ODU19184.1 MAG: enoyl-CoA hydratase [Variovorax sp. SCN 67-85]ODV23383.1 MAG: enoyl-CoA hydratase [Variovorax sp. SCN 67-20]OJZ16015.1 MAG: enoyl-CoA hydratase [Variovorax sp. 67-131]
MSIDLEVSEHIAVVRLDKQPVNALDRATRRRLIEIFDEVSERADVRVAILTGTGKFFCAGADLKDRPDAGKAGDFLDHNRWTRETGNAIRECAKPVIAAVNGPALGAGFGLMASCDIFLASEDATFAMPEINVGLAGGVSMLRTMVGRSFTRRMFFTGMKVSAAELYRRGVLDEVVPAEQLMPLAMEIAQEIASKAPLAIAYAKQAANMMDLMPQRDGYRFEQNFTMALARTEDAQEARKAFLEKRTPVYKGR